MLKLAPLFSGSSGNCTLIQTPNANILVDAGYSFRATLSKLAEYSLTLGDISAIIVTHEHIDHIRALKNWHGYVNTPVFVPKACQNAIVQTTFCTNIQTSDGGFDVGDVRVTPLALSHDARACFAYKFSCKQSAVAVATDMGIASPTLVDFLADCKTVMLESNHDEQMLWQGPYPTCLKRRIASDLGHLSNSQTTQVLRNLLGSSVKNVVLAHLSEKNNTKQKALEQASQMYGEHNLVVGKDVFLFVADQRQNEICL